MTDARLCAAADLCANLKSPATLEAAAGITAVTQTLLKSDVVEHNRAALLMLTSVLKTFGEVAIRTRRHRAEMRSSQKRNWKGGDLVQEERVERCDFITNAVEGAMDFVRTLASRPGLVGVEARGLKSRAERFLIRGRGRED